MLDNGKGLPEPAAQPSHDVDHCHDEMLRHITHSLSYIKQYPVYYAGPAKAGVGCLLLCAASDQEHVPTRSSVSVDEYCIARKFHHVSSLHLTLAMWHCA